MSTRRKWFLGIAGLYLVVLVALGIGVASGGKNDEFKPQNEFKLDTWIDLPGPMDFNKAVMYLLISTLLTIGTMLFIANRMQARPNRVQTAVEALYALMRDNITRGSMSDAMARKWFPFIGALFLFIWFNNLIGYIPLPTNTHEKVDDLRARDPVLRALRGDGEPLDPARARADRVRLLQRRGHPREGLRRLPEGAGPGGRQGRRWRRSSSSWSSCRTSCA